MARKYKQKKQHFEPVEDERDNVFEGISEDEINHFHEEKDIIGFDSGTEVSNDLLDDEVLAISDANSEDMEEALRKVPGLRQHMIDQDKSEVEQSVDEEVWGKRRSAFYDDDVNEDDEAAYEEEEEAERIQQEKLRQMTEEDYMDDSLGAMIKRGVKSQSTDQIQASESENEVVEKSFPEFSRMTQEQIDEFVQSEAPELNTLLREFEEKAAELNEGPATKLLDQMKNTSDGISLLEVKNHILLNYLLNLSFYFYMRLDGIEGVLESKSHEVVQRLVEYRLFLEKIKPLEAKVRYQVDKLVKAAVVGQSDHEVGQEEDPLNYKPSLDNFVVPQGKEDSDDDGIYKPPRIAPVHYDDDVKSKADRKKEREERRLIQQLGPSKAIMQDIVADMNDVPEEVYDAGNMFHYNNAAKTSVDRKWAERARAEEELMMRVTTSKKDKKEVRQQKKLVDEMAQLEAFGDFGRLKREDDDFDFAPLQKKIKTSAPEMDNDKDDSEVEPVVHSEDEYYREQMQENDLKKERKKQLQEPLQEEDYEDDEELSGKRQVGYDIMKNKGLTPKRSKEQRNPRVKRRMKYERSMTKLKSVKSMHRENTGNYRGEETGIKKNLTRSVKYNY